ncbi:hypothetical protein H5410_040076, partial [Solanum commersonii]
DNVEFSYNQFFQKELTISDVEIYSLGIIAKEIKKIIFTYGWHKFVKEKGLRAKDTIIFKKLYQPSVKK